jgi:hypothetical protein
MSQVENYKKILDDTVDCFYFDLQNKLPLVIRAKDPSSELDVFYKKHRVEIEQLILEDGAVLFRDFKVVEQQDFERFVAVSIDKVMPYLGGATPRKTLSNTVATSTEFPMKEEIKLHNEMSHEIKIPSLLTLCCLIPSISGGQTQIADVNKVLSKIDPKIVSEFKQRNGWKLIRNFGMGFGPTVADGFGMTDIKEIKQNCVERDIEMQVIAPEHVRTNQYRRAVRPHPATGMELWFNHIVFWHTSSMPKAYFKFMSQQYAIEEFPYATMFGDGTVIPDQYTQNIRQAYSDSETCFDWEKGDVMLVDNFRVAHGRKPYEGDRSIIVSMGRGDEDSSFGYC